MKHRVRAALLALTIGITLLIGCVDAWRAIQRPVRAFIAPGAVAIQVRSLGFQEQQITYESPGPPYGWYFIVVRNLAADRWELPIERRNGVRTSAEIYWRIVPLWLVYLKEEVALQGDAHIAHITIRREIIVPWRDYLGE